MASSDGEQVALGADNISTPFNLPDMPGLDERIQDSGSFQQKDSRSDHASKVKLSFAGGTE